MQFTGLKKSNPSRCLREKKDRTRTREALRRQFTLRQLKEVSI